VLTALATCLGAACASPAPSLPQSAAPGAAASPAQRVRQGYTAGDVAFMQGMIPHHAQALAMAALIPARTQRRDFLLMAERLEVSQKGEIALMKKWLVQRAEEVPDDDAHIHAAMGHGTMMPGMLNDAELAALGAATGTSFERLFLQGMIRHHEGAVMMVEQLFRSGSGQEAELFLYATDVNADQSAEIKRMRAMLAATGS